jgi:hypothetical protein
MQQVEKRGRKGDGLIRAGRKGDGLRACRRWILANVESITCKNVWIRKLLILRSEILFSDRLLIRATFPAAQKMTQIGLSLFPKRVGNDADGS